MFRAKKINNLNDYFQPLSKRDQKTVYFTRITGTSKQIFEFIKRYYDVARTVGVIIDGKIPNPTVQNLSYFDEIMGKEFHLELNFISGQLKKWLPRMTEQQRGLVSSSIYDSLKEMMQSGKNENMLKNAYVKYMCWMYYKFERIANSLGTENLPKIIYCGDISYYELQMLVVLSKAGADIVFLDCGKPDNYLSLDSGNKYSALYDVENLEAFPRDFNLKWVQTEINKTINQKKLCGDGPSIKNSTNIWAQKNSLDLVLTDIQQRGSEKHFFYNCFIQQFGTANKLIYFNELHSLYKQLQESKRNVCVVNKSISPPTPEEIATIRRQNYSTTEELIVDLKKNFDYVSNLQLKRLIVTSFAEVILAEQEKENLSIRKITNYAVYLLCWIRRYHKELFSNWKEFDLAVFILFGNCDTECEALFLRFLSKLPVDVLILIPKSNGISKLVSDEVIELRYAESASLEYFPNHNEDVRLETVAYQAERELDQLMYQDSGLYRNHQFKRAEIVFLKTMYEEISILWDQELKYRPGFSTQEQTVTLPVILAKISGVKNGNTAEYWSGIKSLITQDTLVVVDKSYISATETNLISSYATQFLQNKKLMKGKIKEHKHYHYGILRDEMQEHLLDKLQLMLNQKIIKGTYENGMEYKIISTVLNLNQTILRLIQKYDFTKKNPKIIFISTKEQVLSLEDSILAAFLGLIGFDVLFFVPTGYQSIERYFKNDFVYEQQIGEFMYDLNIPDFNKKMESNNNIIKNIFRRRG